VIRADNPSELGAAYSRLASLLAAIESEGSGAPGADLSRIIVERYIPGTEVAVEGILNDGALQVICIFDKPDPLEGPYFEESIYTTPSRLPEEWKSELRRTVQRAVSAIGLRWGPVHAEARLNDQGVWILEINPRTIGGKCARMFRLGSGMALEEMVLRQALDMPLDADLSPRESLGVLMLGVPEHGLLEGVRGLEEARNVVGVQEVTMTAHAGQLLTPLPEGGAYPGFVIATGDTPAQVEETLREAGRLLQLKMRSVGPVTGPSRS
jgi:biotin carboxylase